MKAIQVSNEKLMIGEVLVPVMGERDVLIKVHAAGVNRADILQRCGKYPPPAGASTIIGLEVAGVVAGIGTKVKRWKIGDRVCALLEGGGYAEYAVAYEGQVLPIPENLSYIEAASLPEAVSTIWSNLFYYGKAKKGEILLLHSASSGIGVMAIKIAKLFGMKVIVTTSTDEKCKILQQVGADFAINYNKDDFVLKIQEITNYKGVDVIIDIIGHLQKNLSIAAHGGRIIYLSFLGSAKSEVNFIPLLLKNIHIMGTTLRNCDRKYKSYLIRQIEEKLWPHVISGKMKPVIDRVFPLEKAQDAHDFMDKASHIGKIILHCVE